MSREEYMKQLAYLLQDISESERDEALAWYEDYFEEAGKENEQEVIRTLGSPEKVAAVIKDGLNGGSNEAGEYTETGYQDERFREDNKVPDTWTASAREDNDTNVSYEQGETKKKRKWGTGEILLVVILCILALPVLGSLAGGIIGILAGIFAIAAAVVVALPVCMAAAAVTGVVCVLVGIVQLFFSPIKAFLLVGCGFLALAVGILCLLGCMVVFGKWIPWAARKVTGWCGRILGKRRCVG